MFQQADKVREISWQYHQEKQRLENESRFEERVKQIKNRIDVACYKGDSYVNIPTSWVTDKIASLLRESGYDVTKRERCDRKQGESWVSTYLRISW